jgi:2-polyprenyl-3-methyl-5-hydroxy-6-metoxy-1,4-benzoquinol methylase
VKNDEVIESDYEYTDSSLGDSHVFLLPEIFSIINKLELDFSSRVFDLGCGNGAVANVLDQMGFAIKGVDPSNDGIRQAHLAYPGLDLTLGSAYEKLHEKYGTFEIVISLEVVEHLYYPRTYAKTIFDLLEPGGIAIISTPYHGYFKNLALALLGKFDNHFTALWDNGHIKFWSVATLSRLLHEVNFNILEFRLVGRIPCLARSMIAVVKKPLE